MGFKVNDFPNLSLSIMSESGNMIGRSYKLWKFSVNLGPAVFWLPFCLYVHVFLPSPANLWPQNNEMRKRKQHNRHNKFFISVLCFQVFRNWKMMQISCIFLSILFLSQVSFQYFDSKVGCKEIKWNKVLVYLRTLVMWSTNCCWLTIRYNFSWIDINLGVN